MKFVQHLATFMTLCLLWALVRFTQHLLECCDRDEANAVSNAELWLQDDILAMLGVERNLV